MLRSGSNKRLEGVSAKLVSVVELAASYVPFEVYVVEGKRSKERQEQLYAQGRTKPGKIVTWTLNSKHIDGLAVDLAPMVEGAIQWDDTFMFVVIGQAMKKASKELNIPIKWGYDWDGDGILQERGETDGPHFELRNI